MASSMSDQLPEKLSKSQPDRMPKCVPNRLTQGMPDTMPEYFWNNIYQYMAGIRLRKQIRNRDSWQKRDSWGSRFCLIFHEVRRLGKCDMMKRDPKPMIHNKCYPSYAWKEHHCKTKLNTVCFAYASEPSVAENICIYSLWSSFSFKITS